MHDRIVEYKQTTENAMRLVPLDSKPGPDVPTDTPVEVVRPDVVMRVAARFALGMYNTAECDAGYVWSIDLGPDRYFLLSWFYNRAFWVAFGSAVGTRFALNIDLAPQRLVHALASSARCRAIAAAADYGDPGDASTAAGGGGGPRRT